MARFSTYKKLSNITAGNTSAQLIECCDEDLRFDLHRNHGNMENDSEVNVIAAIKKLAVRAENIIVARVRLLNMKQDRDEPVRSFVARLKGQAGTCKYAKQHKCTSCEHESEINYSEHTVRDVLARGLADNDIQIDLLGDPNQDMPLDQMVKLIEAKETGKESALQLSGNHSANALRSTYKRNGTTTNRADNQNSGSNAQPNNGAICGWCGRKGHGYLRLCNQCKGV